MPVVVSASSKVVPALFWIWRAPVEFVLAWKTLLPVHVLFALSCPNEDAVMPSSSFELNEYGVLVSKMYGLISPSPPHSAWKLLVVGTAVQELLLPICSER